MVHGVSVRCTASVCWAGGVVVVVVEVNGGVVVGVVAVNAWSGVGGVADVVERMRHGR